MDIERIEIGEVRMRILVVGAGAIGGYFGGRLLEKGEDVTFLVREGRRKELEQHGLVIESVHGNMNFQPKTIVSGEKSENYDVILLSTKAYHLKGAMEDIRPYAGEETMILPLLNGISHLDVLIEEFGEHRVIGGLCFIETTLGENGKVIQTSPVHNLFFGERSGEETERIKRLKESFSGTKAGFHYSDEIMKEMWKKYLFISMLSGITTLMRSPIGPICETESGYKAIEGIYHEVTSIMNKIGVPISKVEMAEQLSKIDGLSYEMKSSMQRDMEKGLPTEGDHFFKYLLHHAEQFELDTPFLQVVYANLQVHETTLGGK